MSRREELEQRIAEVEQLIEAGKQFEGEEGYEQLQSLNVSLLNDLKFELDSLDNEAK